MKYSKLNLAQVKKLAAKISKNKKTYGRVFGLIGPLGSGKTTFTKALAASIGIKQAKSPTFVIVHCYQGTKKTLYHIDLYRLDKVSQLKALELEDILNDTESYVVIEWVDKFPTLAKQCDLLIKFELLPNHLRNVIITKP